MDTEAFSNYGLEPLEPLQETEQLTMWKMAQPAVSRTVLVHVLNADPETAAYVFNLVRSLAACNAPALAQVHTIIDEADVKAVVTEHIEGMNLLEAVAALGPFSLRQTLEIGLSIAESLKKIWDGAHIVFGAVRPEYIVLDANSHAKLVTPCYAEAASEADPVPAADFMTLGETLTLLAGGTNDAEVRLASLPAPFRVLLAKLASGNVASYFPTCDALIAELRKLVNEANAPANTAPAAGGRRISVRRQPSGEDGESAVKKPASAISARFAREPKATDNAALRQAAANDSGAGLRLFLCIILLVVLGVVFVLRIGLLDLEERLASNGAGAATPRFNSTIVTIDDTPVADTPAADTPVADTPVADTPAADTPVADTPAADTPAADTPSVDAIFADNPAPADAPAADAPAADPEADLDRYLADNVGNTVPFLHKGVIHDVTLVSYTATTVTIRTKKSLTLRRSELTQEQRDLWR